MTPLATKDNEQEPAIRTYWAVTAIGIIGMLVLLVCINHVCQQAGEIEPISRWIRR